MWHFAKNETQLFRNVRKWMGSLFFHSVSLTPFSFSTFACLSEFMAALIWLKFTWSATDDSPSADVHLCKSRKIHHVIQPTTPPSPPIRWLLCVAQFTFFRKLCFPRKNHKLNREQHFRMHETTVDTVSNNNSNGDDLFGFSYIFSFELCVRMPVDYVSIYAE